MHIELARRIFTAKSTMGRVSLAGVFECFSLEDPVREPGVKIPGQTAIPAGLYHVIVTWSQRFKRMMPLLVNVPQFAGVRIHPGNTAEDTEGCILVGLTRDIDTVGASRAAFESLFLKIDREFGRNQQITIAITNEPISEVGTA